MWGGSVVSGEKRGGELVTGRCTNGRKSFSGATKREYTPFSERRGEWQQVRRNILCFPLWRMEKHNNGWYLSIDVSLFVFFLGGGKVRIRLGIELE